MSTLSMNLSLLRLIALIACCFCIANCASRLASHQDLLVGHAAVSANELRSEEVRKNEEVQVTYLGTNGYLIRYGDTSIVVDPYFSRISLKSIVLNSSARIPNSSALRLSILIFKFPRPIA